MVALIGANGAGKTTTMRAISGLQPARRRADPVQRRGHLQAARRPAGVRGHLPVARGPGHLPRHDGAGEPGHGRVHPPGHRGDRRGPGAGARRCSRGWRERRKQAGGTLSGGEQQMLAVGRALMSRPKLLLLDEPSMGLAPMIIQQIFDIITEINQQGTTVLLVEQNAQQALSRAHRAYVLETGRIVREGTGAGTAARPGGQGGVPRRRLSGRIRRRRGRPCRRGRPRRSLSYPATRVGPVSRRRPATAAARRTLAGIPGVLRAAGGELLHHDRPADQRRVRLHVDADQHAARRAADPHRGGVRRVAPVVPHGAVRGVQGRPLGDADRLQGPGQPGQGGARRAAHPGGGEAGLRGRRRDRHARLPGPRRRAWRC